MDKFSLYELLAYLIPGFLFAKLLEPLLTTLKISLEIDSAKNMNDNLFILFLSIFLGVLIHIIGEKLKGNQFFIEAVFKHPAIIIKEKIAKEKFPWEKILATATNQYKESSTWEDIPNYKDSNYPCHLFNYAYWYLESKSILGNAKTFQSIYYLFRNTMLICIPFAIFNLCYGVIQLINSDNNQILLLSIFLLFLIFISRFIAEFFRSKYILRTIELYTIHRIHKIIDK